MKSLLAAAVLLVAQPALAAGVIDGFEAETAGPSILSYASFANWEVGEGTVDLIRSGQFGITCRSGNYCVDLDGSTFAAGALSLNAPIAFDAGDLITVSWWLSGNQRNGQVDGFEALVSIGETPMAFTELVVTIAGVDIPAADAFGNALFFEDGIPGQRGYLRYGWQFRAGAAGELSLSFQNAGGDNVGTILDDVNIRSVIPEPASWALLIAGFGMVGAAARRRAPATQQAA